MRHPQYNSPASQEIFCVAFLARYGYILLFGSQGWVTDRLEFGATCVMGDRFLIVTTMGRLAVNNILITGSNSGIGLAAAWEFDGEGAAEDLVQTPALVVNREHDPYAARKGRDGCGGSPRALF